MDIAIGDIVEFKGGHRGIYTGKYVMGYNISWGTENIEKVYYPPEFITFYDVLHSTDLKLKWQRPPETEWNKVPRDAKVLYRDDEHQPWRCGHFCETNIIGRPMVYYGGRDSFTCFSLAMIGVATCHMYVKLAEDVKP